MADRKQAEHLRGLDWFNPRDHVGRSVTLVGGGGIGSFTTVGLAKLFGSEGPELTVVDFDSVEAHNVPNQMFTETQIGMPKVKALEGIAKLFGGLELTPVDARIEEAPHLLADIVVTGLDNMKTRHWVKDQVEGKPHVNRLIDGRVIGQYLTVYSLDPQRPEHMKFYETFARYSDEEAEEAVCTRQAIIGAGLVMGGIMTDAVMLALTEKDPPHAFIFDLEKKALTVARNLSPLPIAA